MSRANAKPRHAHKPKVQSLLSTIRANRRELRARGCTAADLLFLESVAAMMAGRLGLIRLSVAAVGRMLGIARSTALRHCERLEERGLLLRCRFGIAVNVSAVLAAAADAVKHRAEHLKRLFQKRFLESVSTRLTHSVQVSKELVQEPGEAVAAVSSFDARAALAAMYVPVHLRKCQT